jgi:hypothetical protein
VSNSDFKATDGAVAIRPIAPGDVPAAANFLHAELNGRLSPSTWAAAIQPSWQSISPNHGFMLVSENRIVGVYVAFYSRRRIGEQEENFCNLAAWCVLEAYRFHGLKLLKALLDQRGYTFTDLSPSGNVVPLNARLNFQYLDTAAALVPNLPVPRWGSGVRIVSEPSMIDSCLKGRDLEIYRDHARAPAARHLVALRGDQYCYIMFRRDRRKKLPLFASILHIGNPAFFQTIASHVYSCLLTRFGILATLIENRQGVLPPSLSIALRSPRPKMFRSGRLVPSEVDYLYSELTCVPW